MTTRVLIVDDSAFARKVLRDVLVRAPDLEIVGVARDGLEALEKISELRPDVVTLDLMMPGLDGLGVLRALHALGAPRVVIVSTSEGDSTLAVEALQSGAVALVHKPTALAMDRLYEMGDELIEKVRAASLARPLMPSAAPAIELLAAAGTTRVVVLGTSTGGPQALTRFLMALPASLPVPIVIALHIPAGYTDALAQRLDGACAVTVREAHHGQLLTPGLVVIAPGGQHARVKSSGGVLSSDLGGPADITPHAPSVDVLFASAVVAVGAHVLGVVLTGMGDDGLRGAGAIRAAGGKVLAESASSCVVYGMPRCVVDAGYANETVPIDDMALTLLRSL